MMPQFIGNSIVKMIVSQAGISYHQALSS